MTDDLRLFELGADPEPLPALAEPRLGALNTKWTRYKGTHRPCDLCVQRIHDRGVTGAPPPRTARHKRVGPNDTLLLCAEDGEEMQRKDAEARAEHDRRVQAHEDARCRARASTAG